MKKTKRKSKGEELMRVKGKTSKEGSFPRCEAEREIPMWSYKATAILLGKPTGRSCTHLVAGD